MDAGSDPAVSVLSPKPMECVYMLIRHRVPVKKDN